MSVLLAIDPGNIESAYVLMDGYRPIAFDKIPNEAMIDVVSTGAYHHCVIEMVESYGMAVGREVFDTCVWIGRFSQAGIAAGMAPYYVPRREVKLTLCGSPRAKDTNVRQALIDRFAEHDLKNGKGTKKNPDWFYGFKADVWAAYAVGVTWLDQKGEKA